MLQFVLGFLAMTRSCASPRRDDLRVYKGELDTLNEFPFLVSLQVFYQPYNTSGSYVHACTGSLIADNWVLTAAHCLEPGRKVIRYGDFIVPATGPTETKLYAKILRQYAPSSTMIGFGYVPRDDIGLVLAEKIPKPHVKLRAVDYRALFGLPVKYAGFGLKTLIDEAFISDIKPYPDAPRVGEGIIIPCKNIEGIGPVICVASKCSNNLQDSRQGDSGGQQLVQGGLVVGVVKGPASGRLVMGGGSYTPVSIYLDWVKHVMSTEGL